MEYAEHERLFDEIRGKLNELGGQKALPSPHEIASERLEKMQFQLKKSQEELFTVRHEMEEKIRSMDNLTCANTDLSRELKRQSEQLESERSTNSKLSSDLAKSLELNLKLQYEIEEIRARAQAAVNEEKKHNMFLQDKVKTLSHELELAQALNNEIRLELSKAKDEVQSLTESLTELEEHAQKQSDVMKNLSEVAEKKIVELKMGLDKKTAESQDAFSQLQQVFSQIQVLRQENSALKEYINKMSSLNTVAQRQ
jgi:chromosome segregation ATPase